MALAFISGIGGGELLIIMVVFLLLFGSKKLPGIARNLGKAMAELQRAAREVREEFLNADRELNAPPPPTAWPRASPPSETGSGEGGEWHPDMEAYGYEPPSEPGGPSAGTATEVAPAGATTESPMAAAAPIEPSPGPSSPDAPAGSKPGVIEPASTESDGETRAV